MTDPFRIRDHVRDFDAIQRRYEALSTETRATRRHHADIAYGPHPAERADVFLPDTLGPSAPIHLFIHGGYWRSGSRKIYGYMAEPVLAAGGVAVIADYALMPDTRMAEIVAQVRRAAAWTVASAAKYGADPARFAASGHSAGAHLASYLAATAPFEAAPPAPRPRALLLVSGIYDLAPIPQSFLQPEIHMTQAEVTDWSPVDARPAPDCTRILAVGADETAPFHAQMARLSDGLPDPAETVSLPGLDHMSVILAMGDPATAAGGLLARVVGL